MIPTRRIEQFLGNVAFVCACPLYLMPEYLLSHRILHSGKPEHEQVVGSYQRFSWGLSYIKLWRKLYVIIKSEKALTNIHISSAEKGNI